MRPSKVLIVEDQIDLAQMTKTLLIERGYEVITASTADEAFHNFKDDSIDIILMDWMIPSTDATEMLGLVHSGSNAPVVMVTSKSALWDKEVALMHGAKAYLIKPVNIEDIVEAIEFHKRELKVS